MEHKKISEFAKLTGIFPQRALNFWNARRETKRMELYEKLTDADLSLKGPLEFSWLGAPGYFSFCFTIIRIYNLIRNAWKSVLPTFIAYTFVIFNMNEFPPAFGTDHAKTSLTIFFDAFSYLWP